LPGLFIGELCADNQWAPRSRQQ